MRAHTRTYTYRSLSNSAGRSNFISFVYFFTCASREKLSFNTLLMYLEIWGKTRDHYFNLLFIQLQNRVTWMHSLVNGPKQPFGLFVKRHHHLVKSCQLGGDLTGDVGIRELLCAHSGILEERGQTRLQSLHKTAEGRDRKLAWHSWSFGSEDSHYNVFQILNFPKNNNVQMQGQFAWHDARLTLDLHNVKIKTFKKKVTRLLCRACTCYIRVLCIKYYFNCVYVNTPLVKQVVVHSQSPIVSGQVWLTVIFNCLKFLWKAQKHIMSLYRITSQCFYIWCLQEPNFSSEYPYSHPQK